MVELLVQKKRIIYSTTTETTTTEGEDGIFTYYHCGGSDPDNNSGCCCASWDNTSKNTTFNGGKALRLDGNSGIYLKDIFNSSGVYQIDFKLHYLESHPTEGGFVKIGAYQIPGYNTGMMSQNGGANVWDDYEFPTSGSYSVTVVNPGNFNDFIWQAAMFDDVYVYDIVISGVDNSDFYDEEPVTTTTTIISEEELYNWMTLDIDENENIVLSKSLKDIKEPEKLKNTYSKVFKLPVTQKNSNFFGYINNNDSIPSYNMNLIQKAILKFDELSVIEGKIEVTKIITDKSGAKWFNIVFFSEGIRVFDNLSKKKLNNLVTDFNIEATNSKILERTNYSGGKELVDANKDYGFGIFNRGIRMENGNLMKTWTYNNTDIGGYRGLLKNDIIPFITSTSVLKNICNNEGYEITGSLLNDDIFKNLIVPLNNTHPISELDNELIKSRIPTWNTAYVYYHPNQNKNGDIALIGEMKGESGADYSDFQNIENDNVTSNFNSVAEIYNTAHYGTTNHNVNGYWFIKSPSNKRTKIKLSGQIIVIGNEYYTGSEFYVDNELDLYVVYKIGSTYHEAKIEEWESICEWDNDDSNHKFEVMIGVNTMDVDFIIPDIFIPEDAYDKDIFFKFKIRTVSIDKVDALPSSSSSIRFDWHFKLQLTNQYEDFDFVYPEQLNFPMNYLGDSEITQMDYIKSLSQMFNLYISVDEDTKTISFDLIDEFFNDELIDLTEKIILDRKIEKKFLSSLYPKEKTYKFDIFDADGLVKKYTDNFNLNPSEYTFISPNENASKKMKNEIKSKFFFPVKELWQPHMWSSQTPTIYNMVSIRRYDEGQEIRNNIYEIPFSFMFYTKNNLDLRIYNENGTGQWIKTPLLTTIKDDSEPFLISFGYPNWNYSTQSYSGTDTFYYKYNSAYDNTLTSNEIYLLTAYFYINALDFINLKLNSRIRIGNELFYISSISNWNSNTPTKIELYKFISNSTKTIENNINPINIGIEPIGVNNKLIGNDNKLDNNTSNSNIIGDKNIIEKSDNIIVNGDNNDIKNSKNIKLKCDNNNINNSNNILLENCDNLTIIDCNQLNLRNIQNKTYVNNVLIGEEYYNINIINDGGYNSVQIDFTDAGIIDGGKDEIYKSNRYKTYKIRDAGKNKV